MGTKLRWTVEARGTEFCIEQAPCTSFSKKHCKEVLILFFFFLFYKMKTKLKQKGGKGRSEGAMEKSSGREKMR